METLSDFTKLYALSKTLRFSLVPQGTTKEHIYGSSLIQADAHRAESYQKVKKLIDEYHKSFIERVLRHFKLQTTDEGRQDSLEEFFHYYHLSNRDEQRAPALKTVQDNLRKQIADRLCHDDMFKRIDKKELIREDLLNFVQTIEDKDLVKEFHDFTTYFTGFHKNRQNMYSAEDQTTAIAHRLINENLHKFVDNMDIFAKVAATDVASHFHDVYDSFEQYLNVESIDEMFRLGYYSVLLTQTQIDVYNSIIGGKTTESGEKIQGLNEYINLYNQQQHDKSNRLPQLKPLYKQILSDRIALSWLPEEFDTDDEMLQSIEKFYSRFLDNILHKGTQHEHSLPDLLQHLADYDLSKIYLPNDLQLTDISKKMFGQWNYIQKAVYCDIETASPQKRTETDEKYEERKAKQYKALGSLSIQYIDSCLEKMGEPGQAVATVEDHFAAMGLGSGDAARKGDLFRQITAAHASLEQLLRNPYPADRNLSQDKTQVAGLKALLDSLKALQRFIKPLLGNGDESDKDERFYSEFTMLWDELDSVTNLYNKVRNRMTRKPYSTEKFKLNFENSTLMDGWDANKERDNTCVILRKDGLYYLAIMDKHHNTVFDPEVTQADGPCYEKMEYKLLPGPNKMLPKVFFSKSRIDEFAPSAEIVENYQKGTHKKGANFSLDDCHALIDFFKASISKHPDWKKFGFRFSHTSTYQDLSGFYHEVEEQAYQIKFRNISTAYIDRLVDEGKIYLFQIYNKDFSPASHGTPNMHTLYWRMLFDEQNLRDVVYKLNGQGEVFFRKSSIRSDRPTHPANQPIDNKNPNNPKTQSTFPYDLIKDRRYTVDKFEMHVPITINFKSSGTNNINNLVNQYLRTSHATHIIGIDRGERNLLYLTLIGPDGKIVAQKSLNQLANEYKGKHYETDYQALLSQREDERQKARESWQTIENIKELKEGYLSQAVHQIAQLVVQYNAIVVLEDLNAGFVRGRQKVERQVYQKFERMLIEKLNYLVDKQKAPTEPCGTLRALQLTNKFDSFQKLGKQSGILYYIPAWNTSKMDPVTGFVNLFDTHYESVGKARLFFSMFDSIRYNDQKQWFEFTFDYSRFTTKAEGTRTRWTVCTQGPRIDTFRNPEANNHWDTRTVDLTELFRTFFRTYGIPLDGNLQDAIALHDERDFFQNLMHLFRLTVQMRNSDAEADYIISPVADPDGHFFRSNPADETLPADADANGAYNIARKGLWVLRQIQQTDDLSKLKLAISNKEWLQFAQEKPYLHHN
jgi:CRISPR-associated protein Cpf1